MERFKVIEKEVKTKAFSKEGLNQISKLDPKDILKSNTLNWMISMKEKLSIQVDAFEAQLESITLREKKNKDSRTDKLRSKISKHKLYIENLETFQRLIGNEMLIPDDILDRKDDLEYYIEAADEEDFVDSFNIFEGIDSKFHESKKLSTPFDDKKVEKTKDTKEKQEGKEAVKDKQDIRDSPKEKLEIKDNRDKVLRQKQPSNPTLSGVSTPVFSPNFNINERPSFASAASLNIGKTKEKGPTRNLVTHSDLFAKLKKEIKEGQIVGDDYSNQFIHSGNHLCEYIDLEKSKLSTPKHPYSMPSYYPSTPLKFLENPFFFEKLDSDTLFFIFYYQQNTIMQFFSAKELKKLSWRFHKKYMTWFQRLEEPKLITDDFEQGTYLYFDFESSWCQRKKSEFIFEYKFLEEDLRY